MSAIESMPTLVSLGTENALRAESIPIQWNPDLPIFAKEEFLRAVGDEHGWLGGMDKRGSLRCILPFTIIRKAGLRMVRFRTQTIPCGSALDVDAEKSFLNSAVGYFRRYGADLIIPSSNNAFFRTYPDGAQAAPYGSYVIDLQPTEEELWRNVSKTTRQNINTARKEGVTVREAADSHDSAYDLIRETFSRSKMGFMSRDAFQRFARSLGDNCKILVAEHCGVAQSYALFAFSARSAYWVYGGNIQDQHQGAMKLLQWEAARLFRDRGVRNLDFYGARVDPPAGSKQEGINRMKKNLGASLVRGYLWKYSLRPTRSWLYSRAVRLLRGGDIVDQERDNLTQGAKPPTAD
jgi:hypothetical protein